MGGVDMRDTEIAQAKTAARLLSGYLDDIEPRPSHKDSEPTFSSGMAVSGTRRVPEHA